MKLTDTGLRSDIVGLQTSRYNLINNGNMHIMNHKDYNFARYALETGITHGEKVTIILKAKVNADQGINFYNSGGVVYIGGTGTTGTTDSKIYTIKTTWATTSGSNTATDKELWAFAYPDKKATTGNNSSVEWITIVRGHVDGINEWIPSKSDIVNSSIPLATQQSDGLMSSGDKTKLDGINISNYLNKTEIAQALSLKANHTLSSSSSNGLMSATDKSKLDGINISNYYNKTDSDGKYALKSDLDSKASTAIATSGANGLMSATDKAKLDKIDPIAAQLKVVYEDSGYTIHVRYDYAIRYANNGTTRLLNTSTGTGTPINGV